MKVRPMGVLLTMLAGWINRHQQDVTTYLKEENKILREKFGTKRILNCPSGALATSRISCSPSLPRPN